MWQAGRQSSKLAKTKHPRKDVLRHDELERANVSGVSSFLFVSSRFVLLGGGFLVTQDNKSQDGEKRR
jgi:hypothetical protein